MIISSVLSFYLVLLWQLCFHSRYQPARHEKIMLVWGFVTASIQHPQKIMSLQRKYRVWAKHHGESFPDKYLKQVA